MDDSVFRGALIEGADPSHELVIACGDSVMVDFGEYVAGQYDLNDRVPVRVRHGDGAVRHETWFELGKTGIGRGPTTEGYLRHLFNSDTYLVEAENYDETTVGPARFDMPTERDEIDRILSLSCD